MNAHPRGYEDGVLLPTRYLRFEQVPVSPGRKTSVWRVCSVSSGEELGMIRWHAPWRQYVFYPASEALFNAECLVAITDRLETLHRWHANIRRNLRAAA